MASFRGRCGEEEEEWQEAEEAEEAEVAEAEERDFYEAPPSSGKARRKMTVLLFNIWWLGPGVLKCCRLALPSGVIGRRVRVQPTVFTTFRALRAFLCGFKVFYEIQGNHDRATVLSHGGG